MSKRAMRLYLQDILTSIKAIEEYSQGLTFETFSQDRKTVDAAVRNLEIIGEAARNVPKELQEKHPDIPWGRMISMRNKVIHEYSGVDVEILWQTIQEDLPQLKEQMKGLPELSEEQ